MRQKFTVLTAVCLCLALAFGTAVAGSRDRDDTRDRGKHGVTTTDSPGVAIDQRDGSPQVMQSVAATRADVAASAGAAALSKATILLAQANQEEGDAAIATLSQILNLDLPADNGSTEKILAQVNTQLADLYSHAPAKQVHYLGVAIQYTNDAGQRELLESKIADLGGDAVSLSYRPNTAPANTYTFGVADLCTDAIAIAAIPVSISGLTIDPGGDHDWYVFDVSSGLGGAELRIETISDMPGSFTDDTDLTLWGGCNPDGSGNTFLAFNDDKPGDFTSRIDTDCLPNDTYYLEVGGFADVAGADNFTLEIDINAECTPPTPDDFEPDDDRDLSAKIGSPQSSSSDNSPFNGRSRKEIQAHNIFPPGDEDWVNWTITGNMRVNMETACGFPTFFNGFDPACGPNPDTILQVFYQTPTNYGGLCNQSALGFGPACVDSTPTGGCDIDGDGLVYPDDDDLAGPVPGFDACIDWIFFNPASHPFRPPDQALATNDDVDFPANAGSRLNLCMPRSNPKSQSGSASVLADPADDFNWYNRVTAFSGSDSFDYEVQVRNENRCDFECENNAFLGNGANEICLGHPVSGFFDYNVTLPFQDADVFAFDVDEEAFVVLATTAHDNRAADTAIELYIGPDSSGSFFFITGDEDGGDEWLSLLQVILPPAADLLGDPGLPGCRDISARCSTGGPNFIDCQGTPPSAPPCPAYYLNVTSNYLNPNYPYTLLTSVGPAPQTEVEPNDDCATNANAVDFGDELLASINPTCDFDTYKLTLTGDSEVTIATDGPGDTSVELVDCSDNSVITCDDDGGPGLLSLIQGCMPAGELCVKVRAFSGTQSFDYSISFDGGAACSASDPPCPGTSCGDRLFRCDDTPPGEFDTCPN